MEAEMDRRPASFRLQQQQRRMEVLVMDQMTLDGLLKAKDLQSMHINSFNSLSKDKFTREAPNNSSSTS